MRIGANRDKTTGSELIRKFFGGRLYAAMLASGLMIFMSAAAIAHHSFAMYDQKKMLTVKGTVVSWYWANPHCSLTLEVAGANDSTQRWILNGQAVSALERIGMHGNDVKVGDKVSVDFHPALDGTNNGYFQNITVVSGRTFTDPSAIPSDQHRDVLSNPLEAPPQ